MSAWPGNASKQKTSFGSLDRSSLMRRVRSTGNASTEMRMAALLRATGLSGWRRHLDLPGKPDFAWPRRRLALFVDGCFWHGHTCGRNITPKSNASLWAMKIFATRRRDRRNTRALQRLGWGVLRVWECALNKKPHSCIQKIKVALAIRDLDSRS
jgi:DNA mismatch endonuclease (patch repair protein)